MPTRFCSGSESARIEAQEDIFHGQIACIMARWCVIAGSIFIALYQASDVAAMEKSTVGVVEGTKLSDAAGQALDEIRKVSRELAELIGGISAQTQKQSASVSDVTRGMQGILKITEETTEGTKQTNVSIGQLTKLAAELRSSVAGFKV